VNLDPDAKLIRMRPHLSSYEDSMARACFITERDDVISYLRCFWPWKRPDVSELAQRFFTVDSRNGWRSWLITLRASPILWTDKPVPGITQLEPVPWDGASLERSQTRPSPPPTEPKDNPRTTRRQDRQCEN
jgi:hypothetical protein